MKILYGVVLLNPLFTYTCRYPSIRDMKHAHNSLIYCRGDLGSLSSSIVSLAVL